MAEGNKGLGEQRPTDVGKHGDQGGRQGDLGKQGEVGKQGGMPQGDRMPEHKPIDDHQGGSGETKEPGRTSGAPR